MHEAKGNILALGLNIVVSDLRTQETKTGAMTPSRLLFGALFSV